jgi:UDP:flavonoid glycosyltransferase YjiC (YdhE family)
MRVLVTTWAWPSHLYALVPLAWAARAAGHEVLVASQPALVEEIVRTGLPAAAVGTDLDAVRMVRRYLLPPSASPTDSTRTAGGPTARGPRALEMVRSHAESMTTDLVRLAQVWRPDVVVFEPTALAGPLAAAAVGVPSVRQLYGTDLLLRARALLPELLAPLARRHGVDTFDPFGQLTIDPTPNSLRLPADYAWLPMRYVPYNGPGWLSALPSEPDARPRVCVTWGHTIARVEPARFLAGRVAAALAGTDTDVVVAVSRGQLPLLGELPDNARVVVDAPLHQVLPGCDLVVAHGGAGTVLTTLRAGIPLMLIPQLPDHLGHAGRVLAAGVGAVLTPAEIDPDRIRAEVARLLADQDVRAAAAGLGREMAEQPTPAATVGALEALAAVRV